MPETALTGKGQEFFDILDQVVNDLFSKNAIKIDTYVTVKQNIKAGKIYYTASDSNFLEFIGEKVYPYKDAIRSKDEKERKEVFLEFFDNGKDIQYKVIDSRDINTIVNYLNAFLNIYDYAVKCQTK